MSRTQTTKFDFPPLRSFLDDNSLKFVLVNYHVAPIVKA